MLFVHVNEDIDTFKDNKIAKDGVKSFSKEFEGIFHNELNELPPMREDTLGLASRVGCICHLC